VNNEKGTSMGHQPKLKDMKMENGEEESGCYSKET